MDNRPSNDATSESNINPGNFGSSQNHPVNLVQDVWLRILPFCGIRGVLAMGQTCKQLRALACNKTVWLELIRDLKARFFLDLPKDTQLQALSTSELISLARFAVLGPRTWSPSNDCAPTIARTYRLHPQILRGPGVLHWQNEAILLPGGRFVLFNNWRKLECWSVVEDQLVWTHKSGYSGTGHPAVMNFAADVVDDGKAAVIVMCQRVYSTSRKNLVEVVRLNFVTGTSELILYTFAPPTWFDDPFMNPKIYGDLVSVGMHNMDPVLLIKLSTAEKMLLAHGPCEIAVLEGCLVVATVDLESRTVNVDVVAEASLTPFWQPATIPSSPQPRQSQAGWGDEEDGIENEDDRLPEGSAMKVSPKELRREMWATIGIPYTGVVREHRLSVHKCPMVEAGEYAVWAYVKSSPARISDEDFNPNTESGDVAHSTICKFRLNLPTGRGRSQEDPSLCLLKTSEIDPMWPIRDISYAGHTWFWLRQEYVMALAELQTGKRREGSVEVTTEDKHIESGLVLIQSQVDDSGEFVHMSAYGGALTYATDHELVVNYYE